MQSGENDKSRLTINRSILMGKIVVQTLIGDKLAFSYFTDYITNVNRTLEGTSKMLQKRLLLTIEIYAEIRACNHKCVQTLLLEFEHIVNKILREGK